MHFTARGDLVTALFDHIADAEGLSRSVQKVWQAPDAATALDEWAAHLARYHPRLLAVDRAVQRIWQTDADAAAHRERVVAERLANCHRLAARLAAEGRLRTPWTTASATDMLFALISSDVVEALLHDRRWTPERLAEGLATLLRSTFLDETSDA
jgi:hypothetical protein